MTSVDYKGIFKSCEMGLQDGINYILFTNPVSSSVIDAVKSTANSTLYRGIQTPAPPPVPVPPVEKIPIARLVLSGNPFVRLAGLSGAAAVILGAYGAHALYPKEGLEEQKRVYETANRYHFLHTLALLGVPLCRFPKTAGTLLGTGMVIFCGTCYYFAFTGSSELKSFTPFGGTLLIFGWLALVF